MKYVVKSDLPITPDNWLDEIRLAIADARITKPFGLLTGLWITDVNLFHLAPMVCMKFRGLDYRDEKLRRKVTEGALTNYVANFDPDGIDHELNSRPLLAFAVCYVTAHYVLDLFDGRRCAAIDTDHKQSRNKVMPFYFLKTILWRNTSGGIDSEAGSRFVERMLSVVATCRQQNRNVLELLTACCAARVAGSAAPALLPAQAEQAAA